MDLKVFDSLLEPTFLINSSEQIIYVNEAGGNLVGMSPRKMVRQKLNLSEVFHFESKLNALLNLASLSDPSPYQELRFKSAAGSEGRVQVTIQPFRMDDIYYLVYMRDVTLEETLQRKYRRELEQKEGYIADLERARAELADYSKNLETKVIERTMELDSKNRTMKALLDSLGQGFFIFESSGFVLDIATKACAEILEKDPRSKMVWEVLGLSQKEVESFKRWMQTVFLEILPFEDLAPLGPTHYRHSQGRSIQLKYHPLRNDEHVIIGVVVVATDVTELVKAQEKAQKEKAYAQLVLKLTQNKKQFGMFYREAQEWLDRIRDTYQNFDQSPDELFRVLHSLKGGAASFSLMEVAEACHQAETILASQQLSVEDKKQTLQKMLLNIEHAFTQFKHEFEPFLKRLDEDQGAIKEIPESKIINFGEQFLNFNSHIQYHFYFNFLFESVGQYLENLNNPWAEVAGQLGKEVDPIEFINVHLPIWPRPYESLFNTLIHAVRNAADHGIEMPEVRKALGKSSAGRLVIEVKSESQFLILKISDDGAGINTQKLREKLKQRGIQNIDQLSDYEVNQHIFSPQLSLKEEVTEISGRGVGMDAIKDEAVKLGGRVWVQSHIGKGTDLFIEVPLIQPGQDYDWTQRAS